MSPDDMIHVSEYPHQGHRGMLTAIVDKQPPKDEPQPPEDHVLIDFIHQRNTFDSVTHVFSVTVSPTSLDQLIEALQVARAKRNQ